MKDYARSLLSVALLEPEKLARWDVARWELVIRQARRANLLGRLAALLEDQGLLHAIQVAPRAHLEAARTVSLAQEEAVRREVTHICAALRHAGTEGILLRARLISLPACQPGAAGSSPISTSSFRARRLAKLRPH
jgi:hypothetical protein